MEEIKLHIYALTAYTSIDILAGTEVTLEELCHVVAGMMEKCTHGTFQAHEQTRLIRECDGTWLLGDMRIKDVAIKTGETIYIL